MLAGVLVGEALALAGAGVGGLVPAGAALVADVVADLVGDDELQHVDAQVGGVPGAEEPVAAVLDLQPEAHLVAQAAGDVPPAEAGPEGEVLRLRVDVD